MLLMTLFIIQSGPKVGIQYIVYSIVLMVCIPTFDPPCICLYGLHRDKLPFS